MITFDSLKVYLPQYLSEPDQKKLLEEVKKFTESPNYPNLFLNSCLHDYLLQGDGLRAGAVPFVDFSQAKIHNNAPCILLTNTCDMSLENKRTQPLHLAYAPIVNLEKYEVQLAENLGEQAAKQLCDDIRRQNVTSYFYLPSNSGLGYEGFVHLDKIASCGNGKDDNEMRINERAFTLSQFGHYLFLFKLSLHLTRIKEGDIRGEKAS